MPAAKPAKPGKPKLLSGENPQIPKGYGEEPVAAYIAAVPGWKQAVCQRIDSLVSKAVPKVQKAVKWNTPLYGMEAPYWFLSYHCTKNYVKVGFFKGAKLTPPPPEASKQDDIRYFHIHENDDWDEAQFITWVKAASKLPGLKM